MKETVDELVYVIHAAEDHALAGFLKHELETRVRCRVFVASKAGQIPAGTDWLSDIHRNLRSATAYLILLTPRSLKRIWIWYEAGAAWRSDQQVLPVVAGGLLREEIPFPLKTTQALELDQPNDASQLFVRLGGRLDQPDAFCERVRQLAVVPEAAASNDQIRAAHQALGAIGDPPQSLLRRMLSVGGLTKSDMARVLQEPPNYVSDATSIDRMIALLKGHELVYSDPEGRWRVGAELEGAIRRYLDPSPLAAKMLELAADMRGALDGKTGAIEHNGWQQRFRVPLDAVKEKLKNDHAETDPAFDWVPSDAGMVRRMADALERLARKIS